jgi:hypothetical protein
MGLSIFKSKTVKSAEIQAALEVINIGVLEEAAETAAIERQSVLIDGSDAEIAAAERRLADAKLAIERARAQQDELQRRLNDARLRETREAITAEHAAVSKAADEFVGRFGREYRKIAGELVSLLIELNTIEGRAKKVNEKVHEAGLSADVDESAGLVKGDLPDIKPVESRVFYTPSYFDSALRNTTLRRILKPEGGVDRNEPTWPPVDGFNNWMGA